jgi:GTP-binding protein HflX
LTATLALLILEMFQHRLHAHLMDEGILNENGFQTEKAFLLALQTPDLAAADQADSLDELRELAFSIGYGHAGQLVQQREHMLPGAVFGSGKIREIKERVHALGAEVVIYDGNLSPAQGQNLENTLGVMVLDRTQLILSIFSRNARTREAHMQVELAHLEYMLPRLVGMWAHLDRERGGIAGSKGTGEKQIDIDRTLIRSRIARLKKELRHLASERATQKKRRANCFRVSLVGYTNAGKTTLMNRLTDTRLTAADRLFATLDSTTRVLVRDNRPRILLSDTVGFIKRLPHELVASFRSTLEVVRDADLLLDVVDLSHPNWESHVATTGQVLEEIGAHTVPRLMVFNKVDRLGERVPLLLAKRQYPDALFISAASQDCAEVRARVEAFFARSMVTTPLLLEYQDSGRLAQIYRWSRVDAVRYEPDGIHLTITSTPANLERIRAKVPVEPEPMGTVYP